MDQSKGKGKARENSDSPKDSKPPSDVATLASRLQSSATALTRSIATSTIGATTTLYSNLADTGKSGASSSSNGPRGEPSASEQTPKFNRGQASSTGLDDSFREYRSQDQSTGQHFNEFSEAKAPICADLSSQPSSNHWAQEFTFGQRSSRTGRHDPPSQDQAHIGDAHNDGDQVLALLSDPNFVALSDVYDIEEPSTDAVADLFSQDLSSSEQQAADRIRNALPAPPVHNFVSETSTSNLYPDFGINHPHIAIPNDDQFASQLSVSQWSTVLNGYTDEIWGDLLPVVNNIKKQLAEFKSGTAHLDDLAIMRLKMILGHVEGEKHLLSQALQRHGGITQSSQDDWMRNSAQGHGIGAWAVGPPAKQVPTLSEAQISGESGHKRNLSDLSRADSPNQRHSHWQVEHQEAPLPTLKHGSESEDSEVAEFQCPWIACHKRFYTMGELRRHSESHMVYKCPHSTCEESFLTRNAWITHITVTHHKLLSAD
jgi:hypothetical protein